MTDLNAWGWGPGWQEKWDHGLFATGVPARVVEEQRGAYRLRAEWGEIDGLVSGRLRHAASSAAADRPAVGDWLCVEPDASGTRALIRAVLPRASKVSRQAAGRKVQEQVEAANIDTVFVVTSLNRDLNARRLERYLTVVRDGGAFPVILLNKCDLCADTRDAQATIGSAAPGVPAHALSAKLGDGLHELQPYLASGQTVALLGSSGVGKSTIINRLLGTSLLPTAKIREQDDRGRHTTTHRRLLKLPGGAMIIDTPGMRELQLWSDTGATEGEFDEIRALAARCRFRDCSHDREPGCAVRRAADEGALDPGRLASYEKQRKELLYQARRKDAALRAEETRKWRQIHLEARRWRRERDRD